MGNKFKMLHHVNSKIRIVLLNVLRMSGSIDFFLLIKTEILIIARAYKIDVAVFLIIIIGQLNAKMYLKSVGLFLIYRGNLVIEESHRMTSDEYNESKDYFCKAIIIKWR